MSLCAGKYIYHTEKNKGYELPKGGGKDNVASTQSITHALFAVVLALAFTPVVQQFADSINTSGSTTLAILVPLIPLFWVVAIVFVAAKMAR